MPEKPLIDKEHRINCQRFKAGDPSTSFHPQTKLPQRAMVWNNLEYQGQKIFIFLVASFEGDWAEMILSSAQHTVVFW